MVPGQTQPHDLPYIVAPIWEKIAQHHLLAASSQAGAPFAIQEVGSWWTPGAQVDVVGVNRTERRVVFGEARWRSTPVTARDLAALTEKALTWLRGDTTRWDVHYAFFARSFGQVEVAAHRESPVQLFTPAHVISH